VVGSSIGVKSEEWKEVGEWSDVESRCLRSGMYLVGVYGMINMMCRDTVKDKTVQVFSSFEKVDL
jgi:hypothetical protein